MKGTKTIQRGSSFAKLGKEKEKTNLPPIKADAGFNSQTGSRGATPPVVSESASQLPSIRPPSAKIIDTSTRIQLSSSQKEISSSDSQNFDQSADSIHVDLTVESREEKNDSPAEDQENLLVNDIEYSSDDRVFVPLSSSSQIEIEDPERQYWQTHAAPRKNPPNVAKEALKRMQAASTSKKLDFSEMGLMSLPEKVALPFPYSLSQATSES